MRKQQQHKWITGRPASDFCRLESGPKHLDPVTDELLDTVLPERVADLYCIVQYCTAPVAVILAWRQKFHASGLGGQRTLPVELDSGFIAREGSRMCSHPILSMVGWQASTLVAPQSRDVQKPSRKVHGYLILSQDARGADARQYRKTMAFDKLSSGFYLLVEDIARLTMVTVGENEVAFFAGNGCYCSFV